VIIIGILVAIAIPVFLSQREKAQKAAVEADARTAGSAIASCLTERNDCNTAAILGNVTFNGGGGYDTGGHIKGTDLAYDNWYRSSFNTTARPTNLAGVGATGTISGSTQMGTRDFDGPDAEADGYEFIQKNPPEGSQSSSEISFPFDYTLPDTDFLRDIAVANGTYYEVSGDTASVSSWPAPPPGSDASKTVVFYKFTGSSSNTMNWSVSGSCSDPPKQGILVVEDGNFTMQPNKARFRGAVVVRGGTVADGSSDDTSKTCLEGSVNADGEINIAGNVSPISSADAAKQPGFYGVRLWSWRELYE
jgi:type II secretory pathway pseudopilin PulG